MCRQAYEQAREIQHPYTELLGLILVGLAHIGLEDHNAAFRCLSEARERLERERILMDWVLRILLHHAFSRYWQAQGKLSEARQEAVRVCELAGPPGEKTYLALAHLVIAETAMANWDWNAADAAVTEAGMAIEGVNAPLAEWRGWSAASKNDERAGRTTEGARPRKRRLEGVTTTSE